MVLWFGGGWDVWSRTGHRLAQSRAEKNVIYDFLQRFSYDAEINGQQKSVSEGALPATTRGFMSYNPAIDHTTSSINNLINIFFYLSSTWIFLKRWPWLYCHPANHFSFFLQSFVMMIIKWRTITGVIVPCWPKSPANMALDLSPKPHCVKCLPKKPNYVSKITKSGWS